MSSKHLKQPIYRLPQDLNTVCKLLRAHKRRVPGRSHDVVKAVVELNGNLYTLRVAPDTYPKAAKLFAQWLESVNGQIPQESLERKQTQLKINIIPGLYAYLRPRKTDVPPGGITKIQNVRDRLNKFKL